MERSILLEFVTKSLYCLFKVEKEQPLGLCSRMRERTIHHNTSRTTEKALDKRPFSKALPCFPVKGIDYPVSEMCSVAHRMCNRL